MRLQHLMPYTRQVGLCVGLRHMKSGRQLVAVTCHLSSHFQVLGYLVITPSHFQVLGH